MLAEVSAIITAYETLGMTPEEIAEDRKLELVAVKAALMQNSREYNKALKGTDEQAPDPTLEFSNDDLRDANEVIRHTAKYAEDEHLKLKAAMYIRDDKKGRKEVAKLLNGNGQVNIFQINQQLAAAREGANKLKQSIFGKVIEA